MRELGSVELGDRLGIVGIILALIALGVTILWPTKSMDSLHGLWRYVAILIGWWVRLNTGQYSQETVSAPKEQPDQPRPDQEEKQRIPWGRIPRQQGAIHRNP